MIYSNIDIISKVEAGSITIANYSDECMRPSSYLLRMDKKIFRMKKTESFIDTKHTDTSVFFDEIDLDDNGIIIHPGEFALASSVEMISLDHTVCAELYQLSCYARIGLGVNFSSCHVAASFGEKKPSSITFEIINNSCNSIKIYPGVKFCHLRFHDHVTPATKTYNGIYSEKKEAMPANFALKPAR